MAYMWLAFFLMCSHALAYTSFSTSGTLGYFRDDTQSPHFPVYYSLNYQNIYSRGVKTDLEFVLNNDFVQNDWTAFPSHAVVEVPISSQTYEGRQTRVRMGRQMFAQGFEIGILDGLEAPVYWSSRGGVSAFGGWLHTLDLEETHSLPLYGLSVHEDVLGVQTSIGAKSKKGEKTENTVYASWLKAWSVFLQPSFLYKAETDFEGKAYQSLVEGSFLPLDDIAIALRHSYRKPSSMASKESLYIYRLLALSPEEWVEGAISYQVHSDLSVEASVGHTRYRSGVKYDEGDKQEISASWVMSARSTLIPVVTHLSSYGGTLYDFAIGNEYKLSSNTQLTGELASTYLEKVNGISDWAYHARSGVNIRLTDRMTTLLWAELEKNHHFNYDARVFGHATYFY